MVIPAVVVLSWLRSSPRFVSKKWEGSCAAVKRHLNEASASMVTFVEHGESP
jgi:hypothetical protein